MPIPPLLPRQARPGPLLGGDSRPSRRAPEATLHPESAPSVDAYTVGALGCIALGILFYELHDLGGSPLGLALRMPTESPNPGRAGPRLLCCSRVRVIGTVLVNMVVASVERLLQRRLLAVEVVDVSKPAMMLLNNGIGLALTAVVALFVPGEYGRLWRVFSENKEARPACWGSNLRREHRSVLSADELLDS